jgi:hypothetical protein
VAVIAVTGVIAGILTLVVLTCGPSRGFSLVLLPGLVPLVFWGFFHANRVFHQRPLMGTLIDLIFNLCFIILFILFVASALALIALTASVLMGLAWAVSR